MFLAVPVDGIVELEIDSVTVVAVAAKETFDEGDKEDILGPFPDNEEAKDVAVIEVDRKLEETGTWFENAGASLGRGFVQGGGVVDKVASIKKPGGAGVWFVVTGGSGSSHVGKFRVTFGTKG